MKGGDITTGSVSETQEYHQKALQNVRERLFRDACEMLDMDIRSQALAQGPNKDAFMLRANRLGLVLLKSGFFSVAEQLYGELTRRTLEYRQKAGEWRHAGALYVNWAIACMAQGNIDRGMVHFLQAAAEDRTTYGQELYQSYAISSLAEQYFAEPARAYACKAVQHVNQALAQADVDSLCQFLRDRGLEFPFLAYASTLLVHEQAYQQFQNLFSGLQLFSALRSLSCLLEVELKAIAGNSQLSLLPAMEALFKSKAWWTSFDAKRIAIKATQRSTRPADDQLADAAALTPTDDDSLFWKSLLMAHIVRNYTTHQMETECALVKTYLTEALGHVLHVMVTASRHV